MCSVAWRFFSAAEEGQLCKLCSREAMNKVIKITGKSTSNLLSHLRKYHLEELEEALRDLDVEKKAQMDPMERFLQGAMNPDITDQDIKPTFLGDVKLSEMFPTLPIQPALNLPMLYRRRENAHEPQEDSQLMRLMCLADKMTREMIPSHSPARLNPEPQPSTTTTATTTTREHRKREHPIEYDDVVCYLTAFLDEVPVDQQLESKIKIYEFVNQMRADRSAQPAESVETAPEAKNDAE